MSREEHPPYCPYKVSPFDSRRWAPFSLALYIFSYILTYILAKLLQNGAKFIQELTPGFKNYMRNLDNFRQAVESPKS